MLALMLPSDKANNDAVKALDQDFGLREACRWMEALKNYGLRLQSLRQARKLFAAYKIICPDVQPSELDETPLCCQTGTEPKFELLSTMDS